MFQKNNGQVLIFGLIFFVIAGVIAIFFMSFAHMLQSTLKSSRETQIESLLESHSQAQILNEISLNNQNILSSLLIFVNAFLQSSELGIYLSFSEPYWKVYNSQKYHKGENPELFHRLDEIYHSFDKKSARGLFLAKGYSERNSELIKKLSTNSSRHLKQTSLHQTLCLVYKIQNTFFNSPGVYKIPLYEHIYNFHLNDQICIIKHEKNILSEVLNPDLESLFSNAAPSFYDIKEFISTLDESSYKIGLTLLKEKEYLKDFLDSLISSRDKIYRDKDISLIHKVFFHEILKKTTINTFSVSAWSGIVHPEFPCLDLQKENFYLDCPVHFEDLIRALFLPHWTAITHKVEKKIENGI